MKIKICCISSLAEAELAIELGADIIGLVGHMPSGPGIISDQLAAEIVASVPRNIETFLLTSETDAEAVIAHHRRVGSTGIQLVDILQNGNHDIIKKALPMVKLVQVIHVLNQSSVDLAQHVSNHVDALLLDSGNPSLEIKELGGTGRIHDWKISRKIVDSVDVPVYLAGGLNHSNVRHATTEVYPFGLDLCSSVRTNGLLDATKLSEFIAQVTGNR